MIKLDKGDLFNLAYDRANTRYMRYLWLILGLMVLIMVVVDLTLHFDTLQRPLQWAIGGAIMAPGIAAMVYVALKIDKERRRIYQSFAPDFEFMVTPELKEEINNALRKRENQKNQKETKVKNCSK